MKGTIGDFSSSYDWLCLTVRTQCSFYYQTTTRTKLQPTNEQKQNKQQQDKQRQDKQRQQDKQQQDKQRQDKRQQQELKRRCASHKTDTKFAKTKKCGVFRTGFIHNMP